eukprot:m.260261 g.260261  ORF g.260261 m.260261 type:complete len:56 (-) comp39552_c0_seq1:135-302(-)
MWKRTEVDQHNITVPPTASVTIPITIIIPPTSPLSQTNLVLCFLGVNFGTYSLLD